MGRVLSVRMGMGRRVTPQKLADDAAKARAGGAQLFTPELTSKFAGSPIEWGGYIQAVEDTGWRLEHWMVVWVADVTANAYPVFRRRD